MHPPAAPVTTWLSRAVVLVLLVLTATAGVVMIGTSLMGPSPFADRSLPPAGPTQLPTVEQVASGPAASDGAAPTEAERPLAELADPAWVLQASSVTGIPPRALAAYAGASIVTDRDDPTCGLGWNTLAAIGQVESLHGSIDGRRLEESGHPSRPVYGVALDGNGVAAIHDTDGGILDGDSTWDRAVGPMQFIPSTWRVYAVDGNGDGALDVQQIDDAALAAATYLCEAGGDLTTTAGWIAAVNAYNPSREYAIQVSETANLIAGAVAS